MVARPWLARHDRSPASRCVHHTGRSRRRHPTASSIRFVRVVGNQARDTSFRYPRSGLTRRRSRPRGSPADGEAGARPHQLARVSPVAHPRRSSTGMASWTDRLKRIALHGIVEIQSPGSSAPLVGGIAYHGADHSLMPIQPRSDRYQELELPDGSCAPSVTVGVLPWQAAGRV